jgi:hypothetical protein
MEQQLSTAAADMLGECLDQQAVFPSIPLFGIDWTSLFWILLKSESIAEPPNSGIEKKFIRESESIAKLRWNRNR